MPNTRKIVVRSMETGEILRTEGRTHIPATTARRIWARDGLCCRYCGYRSRSDALKFELDHIHPVSRGGTNDAANLVVACRRCNARKGAEVGWKPLSVAQARSRRDPKLWYPPKEVRPVA